MIKYKSVPFGLKIGFGFFVLALFLLTILFILLVPKIQKEQYENALKQTDKMVILTKHQIRLVVEYLQEYGSFEKDKAKNEIENLLETIIMKSTMDVNYLERDNDLQAITAQYNCSIKVLSPNKHQTLFDNDKVKQTFDFTDVEFNTWKRIDPYDSFCPHPTFMLYKTLLQNDEVQLSCSSYFKNSYKNIEEDVKQIVQEGFSLTHNIHQGKVYLMWLNNKIEQEELNKPIGLIDNTNNKNYCVSKISNFRLPKTGELTLKEILEVEDTKHLRHQLDNKTTLTWISKIYEQDNKSFVFVLSAFEDDFKNNIISPINTLLPISIIALLISILFGFILFKRWIKNIEIVSNTAREICLGKMNSRCNIKGNDDIGILGVAFDSMMDTLEDNIKNLDLKVENRTLELSQLLEAKELLLREIHHRVKNNLSLTINFIKLQKIKLEDIGTKNILTDIENRIYTMALLHTKLYESENLDSINVNKYISELLVEIVSSYDSNNEVEIVLALDEIVLSIDYALPCGLIINEIVTNAFKYAFLNKFGKIKISMYQINQEYILEISDNGVGISSDFCLEYSESFGLRLVYLIVTTQLNGKIEYYNNQGLNYKIVFKKA